MSVKLLGHPHNAPSKYLTRQQRKEISAVKIKQLKELLGKQESVSVEGSTLSLIRRIRQLEYIVGDLIEIVEVLVATEDQLGQDVDAVTADETNLRQVMTTGLTDLQAEVDNLKGQLPDPTVTAALDQKLQQLHSQLQSDTSAAQAADPGTQPPPPSPAPPPAPAPTPPGPQPGP